MPCCGFLVSLSLSLSSPSCCCIYCRPKQLVTLCMQVQRQPPDPSMQCYKLEGWLRLVQLFAAHWDVVNIFDMSSLQPGGGSSAFSALQIAVLCAAPLALNIYSDVRSNEIVTICEGGWYSITRGCVDGAYTSRTSSDVGYTRPWQQQEAEIGAALIIPQAFVQWTLCECTRTHAYVKFLTYALVPMQTAHPSIDTGTCMCIHSPT